MYVDILAEAMRRCHMKWDDAIINMDWESVDAYEKAYDILSDIRDEISPNPDKNESFAIYSDSLME